MMRYHTVGLALLLVVWGSNSVLAQSIAIEDLPVTPQQSITSICTIPISICFGIIQTILSVPVFIFTSFSDMMADLGLPLDRLIGGFSMYAPQIFMDSLIMLGFLMIISFLISLIFPVPILGVLLCPIWWALAGVATLLFAVTDFFIKVGRTTNQMSVIGGVLGA